MTSTPSPIQVKVEKALWTAVQWVRTHRDQSWAIAGLSIAAIVLVFFMINRRQTENDQAWTQLGVAHGLLMQNKTAEASKSLEDWNTRYKGTRATAYAQFMKADLLYKTSDYVGAAQTYGELAETAQPQDIRVFALAAQASAEEAAGRIPEAQAASQRFLEKYPDHFLSASVFIAQARLAEMSGNIANAAALYDRFAILYPESPWTAFARSRLQNLGIPTPPPAVKK